MDTPNPINEEWVRKKANIEINNLEDVKSLSLPGTYQIKIQSLGDSLRRFTRIKELDLSKNQLVSLEGLDCLKFLEKLNLYYNNISSISEIERLRSNKTLIEIDLRLNPITKEDIDYRLYLIQLLPNIEKIDDRDVKDTERQMALMYFENKNIDNRKAGFELFQNDINQVQSNRVKTVNSLVKRSAGINDENDNIYLKSTYQSSAPSKSKIPNYEQYSQKDLKEIGDKENRQYERRNSLTNKFKSASLQDLSSLDVNNGSLEKIDSCVDGNKNVHFSEETEAYSNFKTRAMFTPNPLYDQETNENDYLNGDGDKIDPKNSPLFNLLDLVDKYWNGTKSLHKNFKFLGLANQALSLNEHKLYETSQLSVFQNQINNLKDENSRLGQTIKDLRVNRDQGILEIEKKNRQLIDENDHLKKKLIITQEENKKLQREINEKSNKHNQKDYDLNSIESGNENLKRDVEIMRIKLRQYEQLQQLTAMLQESHRSLVTTNEHLLKEINDSKPNGRESHKMNLDNFLLPSFDSPKQQQPQVHREMNLRKSIDSGLMIGINKFNNF